jgi:spermidine/putrescine transport system ATP-binding protein
MSDVRLTNVTKAFKDAIAVDDLTLTIEAGEFFSLLGPSGCGKTTTLRMIGGFEDPTSGSIYLDGEEVSNLPPYRRDVNTVFQSYALFPHLTVGENVAYGLKRRKVTKSEIGPRVDDMLKLVDLEGLGGRRPNQLSGGQQQRVALARALVNGPQVLLLDEPLGALDLKLRKQMQLELKRIQSEVGITFLYVTHDQEEAMTMSDRIAVMNAGRLEQIGAPQAVYELPATEFVASFLGASNLLDGEVESTNGSLSKIRLHSGVVIAVPGERLSSSGGAVRAGVRPEKLSIKPASEDLGPDEQNSIEATIVMSTYTGIGTTYECRTDDGAKIVAYVQNISTASNAQQADARVRLTWHPEHTFVVGGEERNESALPRT